MDDYNINASDAEHARDIIKHYKLYRYLSAFFSFANVALCITAIITYFTLSFPEIFYLTWLPVHEYCHSSYFTHPKVDIHENAYFPLITVYMSVLAANVMKGAYRFHSNFNIALNTWKQLYTLSMGILTTCVTVFAIKYSLGVPTPFFFSDPDLYAFYCTSDGTDAVYTDALAAKDHAYRLSCPSLSITIDVMSCTFLVLFADHYIIGLGSHSLQCIIALFFGSNTLNGIVRRYHSNNNHALDLVVSTVLGIVAGAFMIRNLFGTVFNARLNVPAIAPQGSVFGNFQRYLAQFPHDTTVIPPTAATDTTSTTDSTVSPANGSSAPANGVSPPVPPRPLLWPGVAHRVVQPDRPDGQRGNILAAALRRMNIPVNVAHPMVYFRNGAAATRSENEDTVSVELTSTVRIDLTTDGGAAEEPLSVVGTEGSNDTKTEMSSEDDELVVEIHDREVVMEVHRALMIAEERPHPNTPISNGGEHTPDVEQQYETASTGCSSSNEEDDELANMYRSYWDGVKKCRQLENGF